MIKVFYGALLLAIAGIATGADEKWTSELKEDFGQAGHGWYLVPGAEFPGAKGAMSIDREQTQEGVPALKVAVDFRVGGQYIGIGRTFTPPANVTELRFKIKSPGRRIALRVSDSGGQSHQQYLNLTGRENQWQEFSVKQFGGSKEDGFYHWSGVNDGIVRKPLKSVMLVISGADNPDRKQWDTFLNQVRIKTSDAAKGPVLTANAATLFVNPGDSGELSFQVTGAPAGDKLSYCYIDYSGNRINEGVAEFQPAKKIVTVRTPSDPGFYDLSIPGLEFTAGVVVRSAFQGAPDPFFAIDGAFSGFSMFKNIELVKSYLKILQRSGIGCIRDRVTWKVMEKKPGEYDWELGRNGGEIRNLCREYGIKVLDVFHDAPDWTGAVSDRKNYGYYPYPRDLIAAAGTWSAASRRWEKNWAGLEVWNEPEIDFGAGLPGDQPCVIQKVLSYVFKANDIRTPLVGGVFTGFYTDASLIDIYLDNGLLEDSDVFCFHNYTMTDQMQEKIGTFRARLKRSEKRGIPFWISESGKPWPRGTSRASVQDDQISAREIAMKAVEAKACGVEKYFAFIFAYYDETVNNFGMMDKNHTPMRSMAAYVNCAAVLAHKQYIGDLRGVNCERARVFSDGRDAVAVLYSAASKAKITLPAGLTVDRAEGIDGRLLALSGTELTIADGLVYMYLKDQAARRFVNAGTPAMKLLQIAESYRPQPRKALPVIFQPEIDLVKIPYTFNGYRLIKPDMVEITVKINNLSTQPLTVAPAVEPLPEAIIAGVPEAPLEIKPQSVTTVTLRLDLSGVFKTQKYARIKIYDQNCQATPLVLTFSQWNREEAVAVPLVQTETIDIGKFEQSGWIDFSGKDHWQPWGAFTGPSDIRARFRTFWSRDMLQIQVLVDDDKYYQPFSSDKSWNADSVQIAFQMLQPQGQSKMAFTEIAAAMTATGPELYRHHSESGNAEKTGLLKKSGLKFYSGKNQYLYIINLDAGEVELQELSPEKRLGFSLLVNSSRGRERLGYLYWGGGIGVTKSAKEFNRLGFKK